MKIRRFRPGDEPALFRVFFTAVRDIASRDYTAEQVAAWAPHDLDPSLWAARMRNINPFVAECDNAIVGYADVQASGYIDHFFVSGLHPRQGIGALLMARLHEEARTMQIQELTSDVSLTAEPFFAHHGFQVVERRCAVRRGIGIPNALMRKLLGRR